MYIVLKSEFATTYHSLTWPHSHMGVWPPETELTSFPMHSPPPLPTYPIFSLSSPSPQVLSISLSMIYTQRCIHLSILEICVEGGGAQIPLLQAHIHTCTHRGTTNGFTHAVNQCQLQVYEKTNRYTCSNCL